MLLILSHTVQFFSLITALFKFKLLNSVREKLFVFYLFLVVINEILVYYLRINFNVQSYISYNLYDIVTYYFFIYWFFGLLKNKKLVLFLGALYTLWLSISLYKESFSSGFLDINVFSGTLVILILVMLYYIDLLKKAEVVNFLSIPEFWVATGLLVFNIGYLPILILAYINIDGPLDIEFEMLILNILLYGSFLKAFLCYKKTQI